MWKSKEDSLASGVLAISFGTIAVSMILVVANVWWTEGKRRRQAKAKYEQLNKLNDDLLAKLETAKTQVLEPIHEVQISIPNDAIAAVQKIVAKRRGQILGFDGKKGWKNWSLVSAYLPKAEMHDLINELRSTSGGVGFYSSKFSYLQDALSKEKRDNSVGK